VKENDIETNGRAKAGAIFICPAKKPVDESEFEKSWKI